MRSSRVLIATAALVLAAAMSVVPLQVAGAQPPSTAILVPSNNATISGNRVILDAGASPGVTQVQFEVTGGSLSDSVIATAAPTFYGWIALWNSTTVANGTYDLQSVALANRVSATSMAITITVNNPPPSTTVLFPASGATLDTAQNEVFAAGASPGVAKVSIELTLAGGVTVMFTATPTIYGWIAVVAGESCGPSCSPVPVSGSIKSVASYLGGVSGTSPPVNVTVIAYIPTPPNRPA